MDRPLRQVDVDSAGAKKKLVIGASGFLGSHVPRRLVTAGADVRVMLRRTSSTKGMTISMSSAVMGMCLMRA